MIDRSLGASMDRGVRPPSRVGHGEADRMSPWGEVTGSEKMVR